LRRTDVSRARSVRTIASLGGVALLLVLVPSVRDAEAAPPTVTCDSDGNIFNTGYNAATKTFLANGKPDANWEVAGRYDPTPKATDTSLPPSNASWGTPTTGNRAPGAWYASPYSNAQWIAGEPGTSADGDWYYRYRFTLDPAVDPSTFALRVDFLADNDVAEVFVNDVPQSTLTTGVPQNTSDPYHYVGFKKDARSQTFLNHNWQTGANAIIVQIKSGAPYEGFIAQVQPSVLCPKPSLSLAKAAGPGTVTAAGQRVTYSFVVRNTGNVMLSHLAVNETAFSGTGPAPTVSCPSSTLDAGEVETCTATYSATQADLDAGTITNIATASGTPPYGPAVSSAPAQATVSATRSPSLSIVKATTKPFVTDVNEQIPYSFTVTNLGNVSLHGLAVTDPEVGTPTCPDTELGPGEQTVCTGTHAVTQADLDAGRVANTASATGLGPSGAKATANSGEVVVPALYHPVLSVVKATTATTFSSVGQQIPYTFTIKNLGNVTLHGVAVADPKIGDPACPITDLGPGEGTVCTGSYTVVQDDLDAGAIVNQAGVTGRTPNNVAVNATSNRQVLSANARPELILVKSTGTTFYDKVGQPISYTFMLTNTGNQNVKDITVTDARLGGTVCTIPNLAPGGQTPCTATYTTTAADVDTGRVANQASAAGTNPSNEPVDATSNTVVIPAVYRPDLRIVKSTTATTLGSLGGKIPYRFTIFNTGNVTLDNVKISDPRLAGVTCPSAKLPLGERLICDGIYTVTQADLDAGGVTNQATVAGDVPAGGRKLDPTPSNDVTVRAATAATPPSDGRPDLDGTPDVGGRPDLAGTPDRSGQLPKTGTSLSDLLRTGLGLCFVSGLIQLRARRRKTPGRG
jgi:uncharacterized repeat protein (TIGR01451 family)